LVLNINYVVVLLFNTAIFVFKKSLKRVFSCHPIKILGGGEGFDPVKKEIKGKE